MTTFKKRIVCFIALLFVANADITNVFSGSTLVYTPSSPNTTTTQTQICDGKISPNFPVTTAIWGVCTGSTSKTPSIQMTASSAVSARTILTMLTNDTTTSTSITLTLGLSNGTTVTKTGTTNMVYYNTDVLSISSVKLSFTSSTTKYLCTPEFLVVDQHILWGITGRTASI